MKTKLALADAREMLRRDYRRWEVFADWCRAEDLRFVIAIEVRGEGEILLERLDEPVRIDPVARSEHTIAATRFEVRSVKTPPPFLTWPETP